MGGKERRTGVSEESVIFFLRICAWEERWKKNSIDGGKRNYCSERKRFKKEVMKD